MDDSASTSFSFKRMLMVALPVAAITAVAMQMLGSSIQTKATEEMQKNVLSKMLADVTAVAGTMEYADANGDLVADTPADASRIASPDTLVFSYIASETPGGETAPDSDWRPLLDALAEATGKQVESKHFEQVSAQLEAFRNGEVHLIGLSTGAAPLAVQTAGFIPLCSMADADGNIGYKMVMLVKANSAHKSLDQVAGKKVVFVRPTSNSGFKAALVELFDQAGLLPERDYRWSFSLSHEQSVHDVVSGAADVAPIASDILSKMVEEGQVAEGDYRVMYESEAFPPAVLGCAHNLAPELIEKLKAALVDFDWTGTSIEQLLGPMGAVKFAPVDYKDDWANIRRIDDMVQRLADR